MKVVDVPAASGLLWIKLAWTNHFKRAPLAWMGLIGAWLFVTIGLLIIPLVGQFAANVLQPVFFAGFMLVCRLQEQGEPPRIAGLFLAFRRGNVRALMVVGCVLLVGELGLLLGVSALGFPELTLSADGKSFDFATFAKALQGKEWLIFLFVGLSALFKGALWFAPPLLAFNDMKATHAMRWSVYAFLSNFGALLFYGVLIAVIYFLAILPYGAGLLIVVPLVSISNYTSYKSMFVEDGPAPPPGSA